MSGTPPSARATLKKLFAQEPTVKPKMHELGWALGDVKLSRHKLEWNLNVQSQYGDIALQLYYLPLPDGRCRVVLYANAPFRWPELRAISGIGTWLNIYDAIVELTEKATRGLSQDQWDVLWRQIGWRLKSGK